MAHEKLRPEYLFDEEKIAQLKQLAPECFEDGKINFTTLSQNLGDWRQDEEDPELEHFGLFWPGKRDARKAAAIPPEGTLEPVWGDGLKADGTPDTDGVNDSKNIFIEGENLEVLKLLQKSYAGKIKMIYIDPPYNTGNDFVYDDDFTEPLQEYLRRTGQVDEEGRAMTTNKRSDGRFHSKWLSMMYPRLRLARNLLREDGVIFVSIDDNEVHNLRAIMNEIFGEENFLSQITIITGANQAGDGVKIQKNTEYCIVYSKNNESDSIYRQDKVNETYRNLNDAPTPLETRLEMGYTIYYNEFTKEIIPIMDYDKSQIFTNDESLVYNDNNSLLAKGFIPLRPGFRNNKLHRWRWGMDTFKERINEIVILKSKDDFRVVFKQEGLNPPKNYLNFGGGAVELKELFSGNQLFEYPKSYKYIEYLISIGCGSNDIVLDFYAGSGTTAHSLFQRNFDTGNNCRFICVQIPEFCEESSNAYKSGFNNIAQISKERIRRVSKYFNDKKLEIQLDLGFKTLSLKHSNYKPWKNYSGTSIAELELSFDEFNQSPLREGYTKDGLLTEIMLLEGFTLCSTITTMPEIQTNTLRKVTSEYCDHALLVCLDKEIAKATVAGLQLGENDIFICLDSAISTEDKLRLSDKGLIKTI